MGRARCYYSITPTRPTLDRQGLNINLRYSKRPRIGPFRFGVEMCLRCIRSEFITIRNKAILTLDKYGCIYNISTNLKPSILRSQQKLVRWTVLGPYSLYSLFGIHIHCFKGTQQREDQTTDVLSPSRPQQVHVRNIFDGLYSLRIHCILFS